MDSAQSAGIMLSRTAKNMRRLAAFFIFIMQNTCQKSFGFSNWKLDIENGFIRETIKDQTENSRVDFYI